MGHLFASLSDPARLAELYGTRLLDSPAEECFDRVARLAARLLDAPVAVVSLVDADRQFLKSAVGLTGPVATARQIPLSHSFCAHVVGDQRTLAIGDARTDARLRDNPAIVDLNVVAYIGAPLRTPAGHTIGALCVIDSKPRQWTAEQTALLEDFAAFVMAEVDRRRAATAERAATDYAAEGDLQFRLLVEGVRDHAICMLDPGGTVLTWNAGAERVKGYAADEILGRPSSVFHTPEDRAASKPADLLRAAAENGVAHVHGLRVRRDGSRFLADVTVTALKDADGTLRGFAKVTRDVTDWVAAQSARAAAERKAQSIYDSALGFIGLLAPDGTVIDINQTALDFIGQPLAAVAGKPFESCPWWTHSAETRDECRRAIGRAAAGETVRMRASHVDAAGRAVAVDFSLKPLVDAEGRVTHLIPEGRDVTDLHRAEQELRRAHELLGHANQALAQRVGERTASLESAVASLRQSEAEMRFLADAMPQMVWVTESNGSVIYFNRRFLDYTGLALDQAKDWGWRVAVHPDDLRRCVEVWTACVRTGEAYEIEYRLRRAGDGAFRWHLGRALPRRNAAGRIAEWVGTCTDIHEAKRAEMTLELRIAERTDDLRAANAAISTARDDAEAANAAKSAFLANMSHEIRTPMAAILGYADLMLDPTRPQRARQGDVQSIRRNGQHLLQVINDVLDLSKIEAAGMTVERIPADLPRLAAEAVSMTRPAAIEKGLTLTLDFASPVPRTGLSDPLRLRQVLINLISNAIKFTAAGSVKLRMTCEGPSETDGVVRFEVIDSGVGMTGAELGRLFQPFTQADVSTTRRFGGTGLGLTISRQFARMLGGDITAVSRPAAGSTFTATVRVGPVAACQLVHDLNEAGTGDSVAQAESEVTDGLAGVRVLLAEDGLDNREILTAYLHGAGAIVETVEDGRSALAAGMAAQAADRPFAVILMDMQMPVLDGYGATSELRRQGYARPIIALTAHAMASDRGKCLAAGCSDYLTKPVDRRTLIDAIARHLDRGQPPALAGPATQSRGGGGDTDATPLNPASRPAGACGPDLVIRSTLGGEPRLAGVIAGFVDRLPLAVEELRRLDEAGDAVQLARVAHQLRGAGGSYGFASVSTAAATLEDLLNSGATVAGEVADLISIIHGIEGFKPRAAVAASLVA